MTWRRLLVAVVVLAAVDRVEPGILHSLEEARYEDPQRVFRFENSDLFGLGPLVSYWREHPKGRQPRVVFLGNSVTYGYLLPASAALPAHYQRLDPGEKVYNAGINGFEMGSALLIAKASIDAADSFFVLSHTDSTANPRLPLLIPVSEDDRRRFSLTAPDALEQWLSTGANHWRLYRDSYRLQAAFFGTATRQYLYLNKGRLARAVVRPLGAQALPAAAAPLPAPMVQVPRMAESPDAASVAAWRRERPLLWEFGDLVAGARKQLTVLHLPGHSVAMSDEAIGGFNHAFAPYARVMVLDVPAALTLDRLHLTNEGAAQVARARWEARGR